MGSGDEFKHHLVAWIVVVDLDMLHIFMKSQFFSNEDGFLFVRMHGNGGRRKDFEFFED